MTEGELTKIGLELMRQQRFSDAIKVWLNLAEGFSALDGGSIGSALGNCYEKLGDFHAARFWYFRAYEENPAIKEYESDYMRLQSFDLLNIDLCDIAKR